MDRIQPSAATEKETTLFDIVEQLREEVFKLEGKVFQSNQSLEEKTKTPTPLPISKLKQSINDIRELSNRIREVVKNLRISVKVVINY